MSKTRFFADVAYGIPTAVDASDAGPEPVAQGIPLAAGPIMYSPYPPDE